jgi:KUP system potassium uptake protein
VADEPALGGFPAAVKELASLGFARLCDYQNHSYAMQYVQRLQQVLDAENAIDPTHAHILGVVSLVLWSLLLLVCVKYLIFILRADNKGEGGVLSLMALASHGMSETSNRRVVIVLLGLFGAALLFGDGIITPAISVLSAVEGLKDGGVLGVAPTDALAAEAWNHHMQWLIMGITIVILIVLFSVQFLGTAKMGRFFGPITGLWFISLGALGASHLINGPEILAAFNPWHGWHFLMTGGHAGFVILGSVFLAVTGGEALYADMGHFGAGPIRRGWFSLVVPALGLNYLGQGALLMHNPEVAHSPFFQLAPAWAVLPLVLLATAATVIASQALITGTYSLPLTAVQRVPGAHPPLQRAQQRHLVLLRMPPL